MRRPRQHNERHLDFIRGLPCAVCGDNTTTEAAHVRMRAAKAGKRETGMGEKPDDVWTVPLCGKHHREQHAVREYQFWARFDVDIDPIFLALALWRVTGDHEAGEFIVNQNRFR